jgi:hypothetical protein
VRSPGNLFPERCVKLLGEGEKPFDRSETLMLFRAIKLLYVLDLIWYSDISSNTENEQGRRKARTRVLAGNVLLLRNREEL